MSSQSLTNPDAYSVTHSVTNSVTSSVTDPATNPVANSVAVLIPALDEEATLPGLLSDLREKPVGPILVVDNGSQDRTHEVAVAGGAEVLSAPQRGYGAACLAGIEHLLTRPMRPDVLVFLDADHAEGPRQITELVGPIQRGEADLTLGIRRRGEGGVGTAFAHARMGNALVTELVHLLFGHRFQDLPPFRAIDFKKLLELDMDDRTWGWTLQMQIRAVRHSFRIFEMEVDHGPRAVGESKISGSALGTVRAGSRMLFTLLTERLRAGP